MESKTCKLCTQNLPIESFQPRSKQCKKCLYQKKKEFFVEYYSNHKEKICNSAKELYKKKTQDVPKQKRGRKPKPKEEIELKPLTDILLTKDETKVNPNIIIPDDSDEYVSVVSGEIPDDEWTKETHPYHIELISVEEVDNDDESTCDSDEYNKTDEMNKILETLLTVKKIENDLLTRLKNVI